MSSVAWVLTGIGVVVGAAIVVFLIYAGHLAVKIDGVGCPKDWKRR